MPALMGGKAIEVRLHLEAAVKLKYTASYRSFSSFFVPPFHRGPTACMTFLQRKLPPLDVNTSPGGSLSIPLLFR